MAMNIRMRTDLGHDVPIDEPLDRSREVMRAVTYAFVCTTDEDGHVNARQVQPLTVGTNLEMWFGTSSRSRKVVEIERSNDVTLTFDLAAELTTVVTRCRATVFGDDETCRAHWAEGLRVFFPDGPESDDFLAVRLEPHRIELLDFTNGVTPEPVGHRPAVVIKTASGWSLEPAMRRLDPVPLVHVV